MGLLPVCMCYIGDESTTTVANFSLYHTEYKPGNTYEFHDKD